MDFLSDETRRNPYPVYEHMRSSAPVFQAPGPGMWMLFDYEGVKRALTDHDTFSSSVTPPTGKAPDWLVFLDPPRHTKLRAIIMRAFTPRAIAGLEPRIRELSRELLAPTLERGEMDLVADYAGPLPTMVIAGMIGIPVEDRPRFNRWSEVIVNLSYSISGGEAAARAVREHAVVKEEMRAFLSGLIEQRRAAPRDDLLTRLVEAEVDGERLTQEEILGFFQLLLSAATETTTNLINNAILCFIENPEQLARLRAQPDLLPSAIEEVLRYRSPGQVMFRETKRDVSMHGQVIPARNFILAMIGSANRDPRQFRDAERFDIARDPNPHIAFGHGIHFCLGAALSRLEARIALSDLLERVKGLELASSEPWAPRKALHVLGPARLPIRFEPDRRAVAPA
ncbi:cytochrome P450 [Vitiosangium sp. GDMCC 1.1324]|uniref:cytochrome P450 n=1 Tax=Vitiosangium sp. (strain GDMCC 1.1324) TaxID=2138576 RepID=UPI000D352488|nr:cytochrome P450 [Vitiosangium sp. GDMCC 1.1324]PTL77598.1 cytochrome P450 [Vitiosangium sp. GDMCC 1.1324]